MIGINLSTIFKVKLTDRGEKILKDLANRKYKPDNSIINISLGDLMNIFGYYTAPGYEPPFKSIEIAADFFNEDQKNILRKALYNCELAEIAIQNVIKKQIKDPQGDLKRVSEFEKGILNSQDRVKNIQDLKSKFNL